MVSKKSWSLTSRKNFLKGLLLFLFAAGSMSCATLDPAEVREPKKEKVVPIIRRSFASPAIRPWDTWKVYLDAFHPDGLMKNIVCTIDQPGRASYPPSFTRIKEENRKELSGYIYLNTMTSSGLNFVTISLTVQIQDNSGNYSRPAVFPLSFLSNARQESPPPGIFKNKDLGPIMIQLRPAGEEDQGDIFHRFPFRH
jgi:hypothetical protein